MGVGQDDPPDDPGAQVDKAEELQQKWQVQRGDLWIIGEHRLLCGDSTKAEDVARVMSNNTPSMLFCDPLYEAPETIMDTWFEIVPNDYCHVFVMGSDKQLAKITARYMQWFRRFFCINMKAVAVLANNQPITMVDLCAEFCKGRVNFKNRYDAFSTYIETSKHLENLEYYAKAKQPSLIIEFIEHYSEKGDVVSDPFLGSGTTLVACEQTGRRGRGIEIEPKYVSVCLERLSQMGLDPVRISS